MSDLIDIKGKNKAKILAALYNNSKPQGMGFLQFKPGDMPIEQAEEIIASGQTYFDYVFGRIVKVEIKGDTVRPGAYDRDLGLGACEKALASVPVDDKL